MPNSGAGFHPGQSAAYHVQVSTADAGCGQPNNRVEGIFNAGVLYFFQPDVSDAMEYDGLHFALLDAGRRTGPTPVRQPE
jgi:hypothetical protein